MNGFCPVMKVKLQVLLSSDEKLPCPSLAGFVGKCPPVSTNPSWFLSPIFLMSWSSLNLENVYKENSEDLRVNSMFFDMVTSGCTKYPKSNL